MAAAVPQSLVDELRSTFLNELKEKGEESIDSRDLVRVKNDNFWLQRFLAHHEHNIPLALKMMWVSLNWRKEFGVNDITEQTIKMDLIVKGAFFPCGKDKDGKTLLIIKSKMHTKGAAEGDDLKRCIVYWLERTERMTQGDTISVFFDMDGCGLGNMDLDLIKYLIGLFKDYYPYFLNYIIIYEMAWVLSAAFKLIKSWLPEKAIEKLKTVGKKDVMNWVIKSEALKSWGGDNDYVFSFVPEDPQTEEKKLPETANTGSVRKVHFSDGVPMSESTSPQEIKEDGPLDVTPSTIITFVHEGNELVSTLELRNIDSGHVAFKLKTTSPEKFKVRPSTGILAPGAKESITVTLLPGYQLGGLSKDKFLVLSSHLESQEVASLDLSDFWKASNNRKVFQTRLRCVQSGEMTRNGNVVINHAQPSTGNDTVQLSKLSTSLSTIADNQATATRLMKRLQYIQIAQFLLTLILGIGFLYILNLKLNGISDHNGYCGEPNRP